jgi:hypothetical protein
MNQQPQQATQVLETTGVGDAQTAEKLLPLGLT